MVLIERDDFQGPASVTKRLYEIDLRRTDGDGFVGKQLVADLLRIANPDQIGVATRPAPTASAIRSPSPCSPSRSSSGSGDDRFLVGLDNNYPGGNGRIAGTPDDTELIVIDLRRRTPDDRRARRS